MEIIKEYSIQNGKYTIIIEQHEMRMSHMVNGFAIINIETKEFIINLLNSIWDFNGFKEEGKILIIQCRKYPYGQDYTITMNLLKGTMNFNGKKCKINQYKELL